MKYKNFRLLISLGLAFAVYGLLIWFTGNDSVCVIKVYTGLPCPGCGMTRAFLAAFHAQWDQAFYWHPLWLWILVGPLLYAGLLKFYPKSEKSRSMIIWVTLAAFVTLYVIRMAWFFPDTAPMDFNDKSIMFSIYKFLF